MSIEVYRLTTQLNVGGQFAVNTFHYQFEDSAYSTTEAAAQALNTAWRAANRTVYLLACPTPTTLLSLKTRRLSASGGFEALLLEPPGSIGGRAGNLSSSGIAPVIVTYPVEPRRERGKTFIPGVTDTDASNGQLIPTARTAIQNFANAMILNLSLVGGGAPLANFVMWSTRLQAVIPGPYHVLVSDILGTLRRRMRPA